MAVGKKGPLKANSEVGLYLPSKKIYQQIVFLQTEVLAN